MSVANNETAVLNDSLELTVSEIVGVNCSSNGLGSITLRAKGGFFPYFYSIDNQNFSLDSVFNVPAGSTNAWVRDATGCEANLVNIVVHVEDPLEVSISGPVTIVDPGEPFQVQVASNRPPDSVFVDWAPDSLVFCDDCLSVTTAMFRTDTIYATISDFFGCEETLSYPVNVAVYYDVYIPNAFSPNNDGLNDIFQIYPGYGVDQVLTFKVFNRWGALVHDAPAMGWDGTFNDEIMDVGTYTWFAEVLFLDGEMEQFRGGVLLVR
ncbi:MAG: gliding motility-associated C-terminal domain-containing protein [Bacteroidota bacterium]